MIKVAWTLSKKFMIAGCFLFLLASFSIGSTFWISWKLEGGAAAVNEAGRLRMQTYRMALLAKNNDYKKLQQAVDTFDQSVALLRDGETSRPLAVPWNSNSRGIYKTFEARWQLMRLAWLNHDQPSLSEVENSVAGIDAFVAEIEREIASYVKLLHIFQFAMIYVAPCSALIVMVAGHWILLKPVSRLRQGFDAVKSGKLDTRVHLDSSDEFSYLAAGFNQMTENLQELYSGLELKVKEKTLHLEEKQERLAALYDVSSFITRAETLEILAQGYAERVQRISRADAVAIRWTDEANQRYLLIAGANLPASIRNSEQCILKGNCYCGNPVTAMDGTQSNVMIDANGGAIGEQLQISEVQFHPERDKKSHCFRAGFSSLITVPVRWQHHLLGEIDLFYRKDPAAANSLSHDASPNGTSNRAPLDEEGRSLLEALSSHLASAMESLRTAALERESAVAEERSLLARELHDSIAQSLAFLKIQAGLLRSALNRGQRKQAELALQELDAGLKESYSDVRELLIHFRTRTNAEDIEQALRESLQKFEHQSGLPTLMSSAGNGLPLAADIQVQVLHILQEALSNVRKHAQATRVHLRVVQSPQWHFEISDDGIGFDSTPSDGTHVGLVIMKERAQRIGATLTVTSAPLKGTMVCLKFPKSSKLQSLLLKKS